MNVVVYYYYLRQRCELSTVIWPCPWSRVFMRAGFVIPYSLLYPAIEYYYLSLPIVQVTLIATLRHTTLWNHHARAVNNSPHRTSVQAIKTRVQISRLLVLSYCSISYRTYCGCVYPSRNKYCTRDKLPVSQSMSESESGSLVCKVFIFM